MWNSPFFYLPGRYLTYLNRVPEGYLLGTGTRYPLRYRSLSLKVPDVDLAVFPISGGLGRFFTYLSSARGRIGYPILLLKV
jgi:hypothetical protein